MLHKSRFGKTSWADLLWGESCGPGRGVQAQTRLTGGPPETRKQPKANHKQSWKSENQGVNMIGADTAGCVA